MNLKLLHEEFIEKARRSMNFGKLPVDPSELDAPVIAVEKWKKIESPVRLRKSYKFMNQDQRNQFILSILEHEIKTQHNATITISEEDVTLDVRTKDIDQITELDKEYARTADELYRDVVYRRSL